MARCLALAAVVLFGSLSGCSKQKEPAAADVPELEVSIPGLEDFSPEEDTGTDESQAEPRASASPDRVVEQFLAAVRAGDEATTSSLLTDKAREETAKHDLVVRPPGTPTAQFQVGGVQFIDPQRTGAHVNTVWTETVASADGQEDTFTYDVVWALRRQEQGWRVAGIATEIIEGQAPVFLNFEDPSDMLDKWKRAEEIAARHEEAVRQADRSSGTSLQR